MSFLPDFTGHSLCFRNATLLILLEKLKSKLDAKHACAQNWKNLSFNESAPKGQKLERHVVRQTTLSRRLDKRRLGRNISGRFGRIPETLLTDLCTIYELLFKALIGIIVDETVYDFVFTTVN